MKPSEYAVKYGLDTAVCLPNKFTIGLDLAADFKKTLATLEASSQLNYAKFRSVVHEMSAKLVSISKLSPKISANEYERLWRFFYATCVVIEREERFPEMDKKIKETKKERKP